MKNEEMEALLKKTPPDTPLSQFLKFASSVAPKKITMRQTSFYPCSNFSLPANHYTQKQFILQQQGNTGKSLVNFTVHDEALFVNNSVPFHFRGGWFDVDSGMVAVAPLNKMFNVGEIKGRFERLEDLDQDGNFVVSFKQNGAFGALSGFFLRETTNYNVNDLEDLLFSSKGSLVYRGTGRYLYPENIRYAFIRQLLVGDDIDCKINLLCSFVKKFTLIVELLDDAGDPHVTWSGFNEPTVVVVAARSLSPPFNYQPLQETRDFINQLGMLFSPIQEFNSRSSLITSLTNILHTGKWMDQYTEGVIVYRDAQPLFKWKVMKLSEQMLQNNYKHHYGLRRYVREIFRALCHGVDPYLFKHCSVISSFLAPVLYFAAMKLVKVDYDFIRGFGVELSDLRVLDSFFEWKGCRDHVAWWLGSKPQMPTKHVIMLIGAQGSGMLTEIYKSTGKTTTARMLMTCFKNAYHVISDNVPPVTGCVKRPFEMTVIHALYSHDVVFADKMNLDQKARKSLLKLISFLPNVHLHVIDGSRMNSKDLIARVEKRGQFNSTLTPSVDNYRGIIIKCNNQCQQFSAAEFPSVKTIILITEPLQTARKFLEQFTDKKLIVGDITLTPMNELIQKPIAIDYNLLYKANINPLDYQLIKSAVLKRAKVALPQALHVTFAHRNNDKQATLSTLDLLCGRTSAEVEFKLVAVYGDEYCVGVEVRITNLKYSNDANVSAKINNINSIIPLHITLWVAQGLLPVYSRSTLLNRKSNKKMKYSSSNNLISYYRPELNAASRLPNPDEIFYYPIEEDVFVRGNLAGQK